MCAKKLFLEVDRLDPSLTEKVPFYFARKYTILPVLYHNNNMVIITANGDDDPLKLGEISNELNLRLIPYSLKKYPEQIVKKAIEDFYRGKKLRFGEILLINNIIDEPKLMEVLRLQKDSPDKKIGDIVKEMGYASELQLQQTFAKQLGYPFLDLEAANFLDLGLISKFSEEFVRTNHVLPVPKTDSNDEVMVLSDRQIDRKIEEEIKKRLNVKKITPVMTLKEELERAIYTSFCRVDEFQQREKSIGQILLDKKMITREQLDKALVVQMKDSKKLGQVLIDLKILPEKTVMQEISKKIKVKYLPELPEKLDPALAKELRSNLAVLNKIVPIGYAKGQLVVAMSDPGDASLLKDLKKICGQDIYPVLTSERQILTAIHRLYPDYAEKVKEQEDLKKRNKIKEKSGIGANATERIKNKVNKLLVGAVNSDASELHISSEKSEIKVYERIDGNLIQKGKLVPEDKDRVVKRIKHMAGIPEGVVKPTSQGRIRTTIKDKDVDFLVFTTATSTSDDVLIRIRSGDRILGLDFHKLGMSDAMSEKYISLCKRNKGMLILCGPPQSGKTTMSYHTVNYLRVDDQEKDILTIENPIEYKIPGVVQTQVNNEQKLDYEKILKSKLNSRPDVIMLSELEDKNISELALTAAISDHMVISSTRSLDTTLAVRNLIEIGLDRFYLSTGLVGVLAMRLIRKVCPHCSTDYIPSAREVEMIHQVYPGFRVVDKKLKIGWGCEHCNSGFKGQVGFFELMEINQEIKQVISQNANNLQLRAAAMRSGMHTLRMNGLKLAFEGVVFLSDVLKMTEIIH